MEKFDLQQKFSIPEKIGNEESKLLASILCRQRELAIVEAQLYAAVNKYFKFKNAPLIHERESSDSFT